MPEGSYQVSLVDNLRAGGARATIITSGSTFTVAPY
jgi:phosphoserine phosphatase